MNKKGFTLAEILAVVVIISILALLALPAVTKYVYKGKDSYNEKLSDQLTLSGKTYFSDHAEQLPVNKSYAYVTLPEMQSNNYVTNEFKDAEGNECSSSYVYVKAKTYGSNDFEYIPCLICKDENGNVTYRSENEYCNITEWDDIAPTCTYKQVSYSSSGNFNISGAQDMVNENKQGKINSIIITDITTRKQHVVNTKNKDVSTINIKEEVEKYFGEKSGHNFEARVADANYNVSNVCMRFTSCIELANTTYPAGQPLPNQYANNNWTVVKDNGDSVALVYNGVLGSGAYNNSATYLTNNFLNPNKILKDGKQYGCLVDQGSNQYVTTNSGTSTGYTSDNYWTSSNTFYNMSVRHNYSLKKTGYVTGLNINAELSWFEPYTNEVSSDNYTDAGIQSTSSTKYGVSNGTVTFYNSVITGPYLYTANGTNTYWSKIRMIHTEQPSISGQCSAGDGHLCGANNRYTYYDGYGWVWDGNTTYPGVNNSTKQMLFYQCGGGDPYHGALTNLYENTSVTYYINGNKYRYDKYHNIFFASQSGTSCDAPVHDCVTDNGKYIRTYNLWAHQCGYAYSYDLGTSSIALKYRPYIIVNKKKY